MVLCGVFWCNFACNAQILGQCDLGLYVIVLANNIGIYYYVVINSYGGVMNISNVPDLDVFNDDEFVSSVCFEDFCDKDGNVSEYITDRSDSVSDVFSIINVVFKVANYKGHVEFKGESGLSSVSNTGVIKELPHHRELLIAFKSIHRCRITLCLYSFHPAFKLLMKMLDDGFKPFIEDYGDKSEVNCKKYIDAWMSAFITIRNDVNGALYKKAVNEYQRASRKNHRSILDYIDSLFHSYAKILVIRIDLSYKLGVNADLIRVRKDRGRLFLNAKSNKIFSNMIGFVWKLETGLYKGLHYHVVFFFDGSKVREDINIARRIGEYWVGQITNNEGLYFNCNRVKNRYKNCGIGMVSYCDEQKRAFLLDAVKYLTLTEKYLKPMNEDGFRCLGKGVLKKKPEKLGRPRMYKSD